MPLVVAVVLRASRYSDCERAAACLEFCAVAIPAARQLAVCEPRHGLLRHQSVELIRSSRLAPCMRERRSSRFRKPPTACLQAAIRRCRWKPCGTGSGTRSSTSEIRLARVRGCSRRRKTRTACVVGALRVQLEDAAVRVASAGNHLVKRALACYAWEANAAKSGQARPTAASNPGEPGTHISQNWAGVTQIGSRHRACEQEADGRYSPISRSNRRSTATFRT